MPEGDPMGYFQPQQPAPMNPGEGMLPPELLELLMKMLTAMPEQAAGNVPSSLPAQGTPAMAQMPTETEQILHILMSTLQQQQPGQQMMNGAQGGLGAMYGSLGGRPPGT